MPGTSKEIQGVIPWDGKGNYTQNADVTLAGKTGSGSVTGTDAASVSAILWSVTESDWLATCR
jgi:hypothetical protein